MFSAVLLAATAAAPAANLFSVESLIALLTLTALEIVLGIDNIVFIAILVGKLPPDKQAGARRLGLGLAMLMRIALLLAIGWVMRLTDPLFDIPRFWASDGGVFGVSGRDLILLLGGLFLVAKATYEVHDKLEGAEHDPSKGGAAAAKSFASTIVQIIMLDIVFSLDSVITAVGMSSQIPVMIAAVVIAVLVMLVFAGRVSHFIEKHPTLKILALSFLLLIGVMLVVEGLHGHIPRGYIYFAMAFSLAVEMINIRVRRKKDPVRLHQTYVET